MRRVARFLTGKMTLQKKILLLLFTVIIGLFLSILIIVNLFTNRAIERILDKELSNAQAVFEAYRQMQVQRLNKVVAGIPFLKALLSTKDEATILDFSKRIQEQIGSDIFLVTDNEGRVLANTARGQVSPDDQQRISRALESGDMIGVISLDGVMYHGVMAAIRMGSRTLGAMMIGYQVGDLMAQEIKALSNSEVSFLVDGRLVGSTWGASERHRLLQTIEDSHDRVDPKVVDRRTPLPFDLEIEKEMYRSAMIPIDTEGVGQGAYLLIQRSRSEVAHFLATIRDAMVIASLLILLIASWVSYQIAKQFATSMRSVIEGSRAIAQGDLSVSVSLRNRDEVGLLGRAFNEMGERLRQLVSRVRESAAAVMQAAEKTRLSSHGISEEVHALQEAVHEASTSIQQIGRSVSQVNSNMETLSESAKATLSSTAEMNGKAQEIAVNMDRLSSEIDLTFSSICEMTASIKEVSHGLNALREITGNTASSLHELNASVQVVKTHAEESRSVSEKAAEESEKGMRSVRETKVGMQEIKQSFSALQTTVSSLAEQSLGVGTIIKVIADIAKQTNLLSLNAAIISAQAGEHGKGFTVISDEIHQLAERTAAAIRDISPLIKGVQDEASNALRALESGSKNVERGVVLSDESDEVLRQISGGSLLSMKRFKEIADSTDVQARGIQHVDQAMTQVEQMVGQINLAIHEEEKAGSEIMRSVEGMRRLAEEVKNATGGQSSESRLIAKAMEAVSLMIQGILESAEEQRKGTEKIGHAVGLFTTTTVKSVQRVGELEHVVDTLASHADRLNFEIGRFKGDTSLTYEGTQS